MTAYTRSMNQVATYFAPSGSDGFGNVTYAAPIVLACRWENRAVLFRDTNGVEQTSDAIVYVDRELDIRGVLAYGDHSGEVDSDGFLDPRDVDADKGEIRQFGKSPSILADATLHKAYL